MATKKKTAVSQKALTNHVMFVVDRSGSMQSVKTPATQALRSNLRTLKKTAKETGQKTTVSYIKFDDQVDIEFLRRDVERVNETDLSIQPAGGTALLDATGIAITELEKFDDADEKNTSFLLFVITDGEENQSRTLNAKTLAKLTARVQKTDRWTLVFLVPSDDNRRQLHKNFDIPIDNIQVWEATSQGAEVMGEAISSGISAYYTSRAFGQSATRGFFAPNMAQVKTSTLNKQLHDLTDRATIWTVPSETAIQPFVENKIGFYHPGSAYYQLMKKEKVQFHKAIAIVDKATQKVYAGPQARQVLGLPDLDVTVVPGNHGNYDIFVQSTSNNRKLPRGTKLLHLR